MQYLREVKAHALRKMALSDLIPGDQIPCM